MTINKKKFNRKQAKEGGGPILGLDYGRKRIGLAVSPDGKTVFPLRSFDYRNREEVLKEIEGDIQAYNIITLVVGLPLRQGEPGEMAREVEGFADWLDQKLEVAIDLVDESLTSEVAWGEMAKSEVPARLKRKKEDAFAAKLILKHWLSKNGR